jgi:hypothetical protein
MCACPIMGTISLWLFLTTAKLHHWNCKTETSIHRHFSLHRKLSISGWKFICPKLYS